MCNVGLFCVTQHITDLFVAGEVGSEAVCEPAESYQDSTQGSTQGLYRTHIGNQIWQNPDPPHKKREICLFSIYGSMTGLDAWNVCVWTFEDLEKLMLHFETFHQIQVYVMHIKNIPSDTTSISNTYLKHSIRYNKYIWDPGPALDPGPAVDPGLAGDPARQGPGSSGDPGLAVDPGPAVGPGRAGTRG